MPSSNHAKQKKTKLVGVFCFTLVIQLPPHNVSEEYRGKTENTLGCVVLPYMVAKSQQDIRHVRSKFVHSIREET